MNAYVEQNVGRDEELVLEAKLHWAMLIPHIVLMLIIIGFITIIPALISYFTTVLAFTNKKVIGKTGLINTHALDSPLNKINNVSVANGLFGKIFGYADLTITTSSGSYSYKGGASADSFKTALMEQIDRFDEDRIKKQADEMAKAMRNQ
jgi:uncharacterized membrane protein YdbT with pleckstrin-like domain